MLVFTVVIDNQALDRALEDREIPSDTFIDFE